MEIWVTSLRIRIIANNAPYKPAATFKLIIVFTVLVFVSTTLHAPILFMKRVELTKVAGNETGEENYYFHVVQTEFGKSRASLLLQNLVTFVRVISTSVVLVSLNLAAMYMYWAFLDRKSKFPNFKSINKANALCKSFFITQAIFYFHKNSEKQRRHKLKPSK
jgi:hypothetical protein